MVRNIMISTGIFLLSLLACEAINQFDDNHPLTPEEKLVPIPTVIPPAFNMQDDQDDEDNYYPDCEDWEEVET